MSNLFKTEASVMVSTAGKVDGVNNEVQSQLSRLRGVVDGVRGSWTGAAQASFDELMVRWDDNARKLQEALSSISDNIRHNAGSFDSTEQDNAQAFSQVGGAGLAL